MALRNLDNALPITPERPKKQIKVAIPTQKQQDPAINDENKAPVVLVALTGGEASIEYIPSENLKAIVDPDVKIQGLIIGLESKDWLKVCESLNDVRRFAIYHSTLLLPILDKVMLVIVKAMKNPRSALCKTSIMASSDIFKAFGETLLESATSDAFDHLLLLKASQDKKFVCEEAEKAVKAVVETMNPLLLLRRLQACVGHSNLRIRAKAANSISQCVSKMDLEGMQEFGLASLIQIAADLLNDKLPEAREASRGIVSCMHKAITDKEEKKEEKQEAWEKFCASNLPAIHAQAMVKLVVLC